MRRSGLQRRTPLKQGGRRGRARTGTEIPCAACGKSFYVPGWRLTKGAKYCSLACRPQSSSSRKAVNCATCGRPFSATPTQIAKGKKYCSRACMGRGIGSQRKGARNPAWKGRDTTGSIYRVFNLKLKGEDRCRNCGSSHSLHLHHIVPRSMCKRARRELRNGMPLCAACHARWHAQSITIYRDLMTAEEWAYVSTLDLLGQNIGAWLDAHYPVRAGALKRTTGDVYVPERSISGERGA